MFTRIILKLIIKNVKGLCKKKKKGVLTMNRIFSFQSGKRVAAAALSALLAVSSAVVLPQAMGLNEVNAASVDGSNTLKEKVQDGVILHAWQWSFHNITENMSKIADAGYTAVQTSVIQQAKEGTKGKTNNVWWVYYQPANFTIDNTGNSALGTKAEFKAMCDEAHKYGIHVIVDVVANHLGNNGSGYTKSDAIPGDIRNDSSCWHDKWNEEINYSSRYSITHGSMGGLPDLNTENTKIQNYVKTYLRECIDCGADGFRFDAAKHIGVPNDTDNAGGNFWPNVISDATSYYQTKGTYKTTGLYCYGEILGGTGGPAISEYTKYIKITDNETGNDVRRSIGNHNASGAASSSYSANAGASNSVLWAESHDTYSGDDKNMNNRSTQFSQSDINLAWALVGSRNKATALYFARTKGYRTGNIGDIDNTSCFSKEVAEVNKLHNLYAGQSEYLSSSGSIAYNERGTSAVVLVNCNGGSASVNVKANKMAAGTYYDQITGNKFTVSGGHISGQIGSTGIAVVYDANNFDSSSLTASVPTGTSFEDTLKVTLNSKDMSNAVYTTNDGSSGDVTDGMTITLGKNIPVGETVELTLTGTSKKGNTITSTYKYYKKDPNAKVMLYFDNTGYNWNKVYTYIYDDSTTPVTKNAAWPGVEMTYNSTLGLYETEVSADLVNGKAIFTESQTATTNRYPADSKPGLEIGGVSMKFSSGHTWQPYSPVSKELKNESTLSADSIKYESSVTINGAASGGTAPYTYAFYYKFGTAKYWHTLGTEFGKTDAVTFKPTRIGTYNFKTVVKDSTGKTVEKTFDLPVLDNTKGSFKNVSTMSTTSVKPSTRVYFYGAAEGAKGSCTYTYNYKNSSSKIWRTIGTAFSTATSASFKPKNEAVYDVRIDIKDSTGEVISKYFKLYVSSSSGTKLENTSTFSNSSNKVIFNGSAKGGIAPYTYSFCYKRTTGKIWRTIGTEFGTATSAQLKLTAGVEYDFKIIVKDAAGNTSEKVSGIYKN